MIFKIKKIILLVTSLIFSVFKRKADKKINKPKKILILQMAKLGDMVCTTPMFRAVKIKYPSFKVIVVGNKINKEVLEGNKDAYKYIIFKNLFRVFKEIKNEKVDFACVTAPDFISLVILYLAGVKTIVAPKIENGYSPYETWEYKILRKFVITKPHKMGSYAPREYLRLLEPINIFSEDTKKYLYFSDQAREKIDKLFKEKDIDEKDLVIGISPSAGNKIKNWGSEKFAELADYIYKEYGAKLIIIGSGRDELEVNEMISFLDKDTKVFNTLNMFNIDELKALVSRMSIFISVDTGPIYIAEAFDVATIDIVGPMDENEQPPRGDKHKIVKILDRKKPELHIMNARDYDTKEALRQINEIEVEDVSKILDELVLKL